jgi:predicted thioesterase
MLAPGISLEQVRVVRRDDCINFLGADVRPSLSTPSMIYWMEICCRDAILPRVGEGNDSVGIKVSVEHLAATPMGQSVTYTATLVGVDGRRASFEVEASDGTEVVGRGTHDRVVVDVSRFAARLRKKLESKEAAS